MAVRNFMGSRESTTSAVEHRAFRLFRRTRAQWQGRLHEQLVARPGLPALSTGATSHLRIAHSGYRDDVMRKRNKVERNVRLAELDLHAGQGELVSRLLNLARSLMTAERYEEALARFAEIRWLDAQKVKRYSALRCGAEALLGLGRYDEALEWISDLRQVAADDDLPRFLEGRTRLELGQAEEALTCLEGLGEFRSEDEHAYPAWRVQVQRGLALFAAERWEEAADELFALVSEHEVSDPVWVPLVRSFFRAGRELGPVAQLVPVRFLTVILAEVLRDEPAAADQLAERLWARLQGDSNLLALAAHLGPYLPVERALEWSARLRAVGLQDRCPLLALACDPAAAPAVRARAAAVAAGAFGDERGRAALEEAAAAVADDKLLGSLLEVAELAPDLVGSYVLGAATSPRRCLRLARILHELGAEPEARAVAEHSLVGASASGEAEVAEEAAAWLAEVSA